MRVSDSIYIPPELREGSGEIEAAARHALPRLLERADIKGFLHCHTTYSDGSNSVMELAEACRAAGYEYIGITDHSQAAAYAGGLKADDLARQADEIDEANTAARRASGSSRAWRRTSSRTAASISMSRCSRVSTS